MLTLLTGLALFEPEVDEVGGDLGTCGSRIPVWQQVRTALRQQTRTPDQEWVRMLRLLETYPAPAVEAAVAAALARDSPRLEPDLGEVGEVGEDRGGPHRLDS